MSLPTGAWNVVARVILKSIQRNYGSTGSTDATPARSADPPRKTSKIMSKG